MPLFFMDLGWKMKMIIIVHIPQVYKEEKMSLLTESASVASLGKQRSLNLRITDQSFGFGSVPMVSSLICERIEALKRDSLRMNQV